MAIRHVTSTRAYAVPIGHDGKKTVMYQARCSCGWKGVKHKSREYKPSALARLAEQDAEAHLVFTHNDGNANAREN